MKQSHKFVPGDIVTIDPSVGSEYANHEWKILRWDGLYWIISSPTYENGQEGCSSDTYIFTFIRHDGVCDHEWKLYKGFRYNEWECEKCEAKKAFDIYKDAV